MTKPVRLQYVAESAGYTVSLGDIFIGRVKRVRSTYDHSNGRRYHSWQWAAFPPFPHRATFHHSTRARAGTWLLELTDPIKGQNIAPPPTPTGHR